MLGLDALASLNCTFRVYGPNDEEPETNIFVPLSAIIWSLPIRTSQSKCHRFDAVVSSRLPNARLRANPERGTLPVITLFDIDKG